MSDPRSIRAFPTATAPLTPDAVVDTIRLTAPEGILRVQGIAENVSKPWSSSGGGRPMVFGELALGTAVLSFQVPDEAAPDEGEAVVIEGHLRFRPASRGDTRRGIWKVVLVGQVVGTWTPRARPSPSTRHSATTSMSACSTDMPTRFFTHPPRSVRLSGA